ncbi:Sad1-interacting factor 2 [Neolecta irregularis DAH-3]|uniref:Sad1-interacting factor 2 n=1 Tax=Neolecta irregularis (strain DAH-3) TaxID=1198029 RepID=A0A1U7LMV9_NEOID|nr:Sad1-interacting factor 2 [Neolecta irregularis DAH-3]|eukprot:OLL23968.1 Sad1-interacting factor 2 [Neolecta irregularis DAH-3]
MTSPREKRLSLPQRTSKTAQKLKLLPEDSFAPAVQITDTTARRDAERLGKAERAMLPRVTAYCTASNYRMDAMFTFLQSRYKSNGTLPKQFDECIYSPYTYTGEDPQRSVDLLELEDPGEERDLSFPSMKTITPEVFIFEYGVIVFWSMSVNEEKRFLKEIQKFEVEKLAEEDVEVEEFNYYVTQLYQPRISLFEELIDDTIEATKDIPQRLADTVWVNYLFFELVSPLLLYNKTYVNDINLVSSVVDSPEAGAIIVSGSDDLVDVVRTAT